jgi:prepilin-type processing-associated H-X9-DG protein
LDAISDGTSNTLLFGEGLGGLAKGRDLVWSWMGVGAVGTKYGLQPPGGWNGFSSLHAGGIVQFAFADGSVRPLRPGSTTQRVPASSDWYVLQRMAGMADGELYDIAVLGN